jgi:hypothetical protein
VTSAADWAATTTFVGAIGVSAALFVSRLLGGETNQSDVTVWLSASAVLLAVVSLAIRAIRSGLTVPGEFESYREYTSRCQVLAEVFRRASGDEAAQWRVLVELEESAAEELRRFLRTKSTSRFVV